MLYMSLSQCVHILLIQFVNLPLFITIFILPRSYQYIRGHKRYVSLSQCVHILLIQFVDFSSVSKYLTY